MQTQDGVNHLRNGSSLLSVKVTVRAKEKPAAYIYMYAAKSGGAQEEDDDGVSSEKKPKEKKKKLRPASQSAGPPDSRRGRAEPCLVPGPRALLTFTGEAD